MLFGDRYQGITSRKTGMNRKSLKIEALKGQTVDFIFFFPTMNAIIYPIIRSKWQVMLSCSILVKWSSFGLRGFQRQIYCPRWGEISTKSTPLKKKKVFVYELSHYEFYYAPEWEVIIVEILERWNATKCCLNIIDKTWIAFQERKVVTLEIL